MGALAGRPLKWLQGRSLRERRGGSLAVLVFVVAGVIGGLIGQFSINEARARIGQSLATDAQRLAERLNSDMASRLRELTLLAGTDVLQALPATAATAAAAPSLGVMPKLSSDLAHTQSLLEGLKRSVPAYAWIAVADPSGRVLAATDPALLGSDLATRGPRWRMAEAPDAPGDERRPLDLVQPIRTDDATVVGIVAAQLDPGWLAQVEQAVVTTDPDGVLRRETFLINAQDMVLLGPPGSLGQKLLTPASNRARAGFYGASVEEWPDGGPFLTGTAFVSGERGPRAAGGQDLRWVVLVRQAERIAFAGAYALRDAIWLAGLLIAASFAVAGWLLAGIITAPLARIAFAAERLRQGDDIQIPRIRGPSEIDSLSASLRALVATLTRKQVALDEMEELALRDPLTGLFNRHGLKLAMARLLAQAQANNSKLMVFVGDLDGFKSVNDTLGHACGDILLCQVASRLARAVRGSDVVARLGGDEFVLALPAPDGVHDQAVRTVIQRAQSAISAPYQIEGALVRVSCSLGGACWPDDVQNHSEDDDLAAEFDEVLEHADAALYVVKRSSKGRIAFHGEIRRLATGKT